MNTLGRTTPILPQDESVVLFDDQDIEFGFPVHQIKTINKLYDQGKNINYIARHTKRNPHEVFLSQYERWMKGGITITDIRRAFSGGSTLLVPGKKLIRGKQK